MSTILNDAYEPEVEHIKLRDAYNVVIKNPHNIQVESAICEIPLAKGREYTMKEIADRVRGVVTGGKVTYDDWCVVYERKFLLSKHGRENADIRIYSKNVSFGPYFEPTNQPTIVVGADMAKYLKTVNPNFYGSLEHK